MKGPGQPFRFFSTSTTGEPLIDSPGFVRCSRAIVERRVAKMPADVKTLTPADCRRLILTGKAAIGVSLRAGPVRHQTARAAARGCRCRSSALPGTRQVYSHSAKAWTHMPSRESTIATLAPFAGLAAGVAKGIPQRRADAAWNLAYYLSLDRYEQAFVNDAQERLPRVAACGGSATWVSADLRSNELFSYWGVTAESLRQSNISAELPVMGHARFRQALTDGLTAALGREGDACGRASGSRQTVAGDSQRPRASIGCATAIATVWDCRPLSICRTFPTQPTGNELVGQAASLSVLARLYCFGVAQTEQPEIEHCRSAAR